MNRRHDDPHPHDPDLFEIQNRRVDNLNKWYELGIRPNVDDDPLDAKAHVNDGDLLALELDDLHRLLERSLKARVQLNSNLPPHPTVGKNNDGHLLVKESTIDGAGKGLFTKIPLSKGDLVCYYTGHRHDYQSQKRLKDRQYLLKLQNGWPASCRMNDGFVDAGPTVDVKARYINDPRNEDRRNVTFEHIQQKGIWYAKVVATRDVAPDEELFISYGPRYWSETRLIGG